MATALLATLAIATAAWSAEPARRNESGAERLHRKGVYCMEVIERNKCAIEHFEDLVDLRTTERALVTDAMLRLVKLYQREDRAEDIKPLLRKFWKAGMKRESTGHLPYSVRYFPTTLNILFVADLQTVINAPISKQLGPEATDLLTTCDAGRRRDIQAQIRWRRAEQKAQLTGQKTYEVVYEELAKERKRKNKRERQKRQSEAKRKKNKQYNRGVPVYAKALCPLVHALGQEDIRSWGKIAGANNHYDYRQSMAAAQIPRLDAKLAAAVKAGRIKQKTTDHYILPKLDYFGDKVHLAKLDTDELLVAPGKMIDQVIAARRKRKRTMNRDIAKLVSGVPKDAGFFFVMTRVAMMESGMANLKPAQRTLAEIFLPKPKGLQVAGMFHDYLGLFTRVPTSNPVKAKMLVALARSMIDAQADKGSKTEQWLRNLDVAEAKDKRAILASYIMSASQIEKLVLQ